MSNAIITGTTAAMQPAQRLQEIEYEIQYHIKRSAAHLLDVGRCLNAAKDEGVVPHGGWVEWVERTTGLRERKAQRLMEAAREVPEDSPISRLDFSKVRALLALPAGEREEFAKEVKADDLSVRELEAAIKAKREAEERLKAVEDDRTAALKEKQKAVARAEEAERKHREAARSLLSQQEKAESERKRLLAEINTLKETGSGAAEGISEEAQAKIDALQAELDEQEAEIERQAKLRADAQAELLRARSQAARGDAAESSGERFTADDLGAAARLFIGRAAVLPHMRAQLAAMLESERSQYRQYVDMVFDWCLSARTALNTIEEEPYDD